MSSVISQNSQATIKFGQSLAQKFVGGEVLALVGDLGAGKTCLSRGVAKGLGIKRKINSPTFVIMKVYNLKNKKNIKKFCHIDAYRLTSAADLIAIGALDYLNRADTVTVMEWAEKVKGIWPKNTILVNIKHQTAQTRKISIKKLKRVS
ncbi:tRNA (adenosine(37)-N6)-threonylcarbamoyltransferase complex ATPase subunit type 1 TsaE [Candidatus Falkowbacteria bacterium CG_4_10_14_0_2_um_filter_41_15]|uniref:tRNA threonylcarbamoyladenosine biosynthesis protein TsaE n=3 Tax=Candidatus Falkowiibacteriota TaxID=1752728 RepID=A0A2G9ZNQ4_9BACT|nr:MAG: tRNA (adenosine(37)-N6)-threonylcarbamoyltransferase complex ATPase subunit type 1 TsaE [Candidatus Falkowbacteria bacterium CG1_02_41_21]PIP34817.1 MAG: tRNA (adenosine(37)-N6)-threonylcarbamoyltransferase complex ATPase subunit type 1 TsaE [Candidatus Falkowbacteria bacterium CG23_combo_of_CG06-09_8_20_14_all_41_10]PJA09124.1 MAG: tRNA (adenosine(37)-N6)-threonylcarbamoyltransferase complex ATPase subunit type 1 TsaE [Candidatus Falkowbacteria bacterium CG_4_10_14_0_2_um_filter_41_15]